MYQQVIEYFSKIPFFDSAAFGIIAMVIVGGSWCLIGFIMGEAPKKKIDPGLVIFGGAIVSAAVGLIIMVCTSAYPTSALDVTIYTCLSYAAANAVNYFTLQLMSKAMQIGPNGIVWSIIQSAFIFSFIVGVVFFDVKFTVLRGIGIVVLLCSLVFFALAKDNSNKSEGNKWKWLSLIAMVCAATTHNLSTLPCYYESALGVPSIIRAIASAGGILITAVIWDLIRMNRDRWETIKRNMKSRQLWLYVGEVQFFGLIFAYTLFYPGMNVMADKGMGGMCYPMMIGSCIVTFTLTSIFILKEKLRWLQLAGLILCTCGLVLICTK